jgi:hypothetical protein
LATADLAVEFHRKGKTVLNKGKPLLMQTLMITCNPGKLGTMRRQLIAEIYNFPANRLNQSVYVIRTDNTPREIFKRLKPFVDHDDNLYVMKIGDVIGHGNSDVNAWLEDRLNGRMMH